MSRTLTDTFTTLVILHRIPEVSFRLLSLPRCSWIQSRFFGSTNTELWLTKTFFLRLWLNSFTPWFSNFVTVTSISPLLFPQSFLLLSLSLPLHSMALSAVLADKVGCTRGTHSLPRQWYWSEFQRLRFPGVEFVSLSSACGFWIGSARCGYKISGQLVALVMSSE